MNTNNILMDVEKIKALVLLSKEDFLKAYPDYKDEEYEMIYEKLKNPAQTKWYDFKTNEMIELSLIQAMLLTFLYGIGKDFYFVFSDRAEAVRVYASVENVLSHYINGGSFCMPEKDIYQVELTISEVNNPKEREVILCPKTKKPDWNELLDICKENGFCSELDIHMTMLNAAGDYIDSEEFCIYINNDFSRVYLWEA